MAFDGLCVASICDELKRTITDGRISKISQPEKDEVILTIKGKEGQKRLFISCSPSLPLLYLTEENKENPLVPPSFLMVLRKYLQGGRIVYIKQPGLERIVNFYVEHQDEMGDLCNRVLTVELMGKYSNIILCDDKGKIFDAAKRIPFTVSSVREVLPGREYFIPNTMEKADPLNIDEEDFSSLMNEHLDTDNDKIFSMHFTGISPAISKAIYKNAIKLCEEEKEFDINETEKNIDAKYLYKAFNNHIACVKNGSFIPVLVKNGNDVKDYFVTEYSPEDGESVTEYSSVSKLLFDYYNEKNKTNNIRSKSFDLRKHITNILDKDIKKLKLQNKQLEDTKNKDTFKLYGELLQAYSYDLKGGEKSYEALNYYNNEKVIIPLNPTKSVFENSQNYFAKYNKLKRTEIALETQTEAVKDEIEYLESILAFVNMASSENDLTEIKEELYVKGLIRKNPKGKDKKVKTKITHLKYKDYDIYLGKNNIQNEQVTFKMATGNDWWFHAKGVPGSHVIVKCDKENPASEWDMPADAFEVAGALAAFYSKHEGTDKVEIDYTRKKHIKKPAEGNRGMVIYHTYYSMVADPDIKRFDLTTII